MTLADIKMALFDGAVVRIIGIDYADCYSVNSHCGGTSLVAYANDEACSFEDVFSAIERSLRRFGAHVFRCVTDDGDVTITIIIEIGEEIQ